MNETFHEEIFFANELFNPSNLDKDDSSYFKIVQNEFFKSIRREITVIIIYYNILTSQYLYII